MLRLIGIVISIGLADSLNPTTVAPALYLASGPRGRERVTEFTLAVFAVYLAGGIAIALGPGRLLISLIPHPHHRLGYIIEIAAGAALMTGAGFLWRHRFHLSERDPPAFDSQGKTSWLLGATITAVELPTAFPYFAVIAAVVSSGTAVLNQILLLLLFNVCFVLPLVAIVAIVEFAGDQADRVLRIGRRFLHRHWPTLLATLGAVAGALVLLLGVTGLAAGHNHFGRFMRHFHRLLHP